MSANTEAQGKLETVLHDLFEAQRHLQNARLQLERLMISGELPLDAFDCVKSACDQTSEGQAHVRGINPLVLEAHKTLDALQKAQRGYDANTVPMQLDDSFMFISDIQHMRPVLESFLPAGADMHKVMSYWCSLFVKTGDGEYIAVYGCEHSVPNDNSDLYLLYDNVRGAEVRNLVW